MYTPPTAMPIQAPTAPRTIPTIADGRRPSQPDERFGAMLNTAVAAQEGPDRPDADIGAAGGAAAEERAVDDTAVDDRSVEDGTNEGSGIAGDDPVDADQEVEATDGDAGGEVPVRDTGHATPPVATDPPAPQVDLPTTEPADDDAGVTDPAGPEATPDAAVDADRGPTIAAEATMSAGFRARLQAAGTSATSEGATVGDAVVSDPIVAATAHPGTEGAAPVTAGADVDADIATANAPSLEDGEAPSTAAADGPVAEPLGTASTASTTGTGPTTGTGQAAVTTPAPVAPTTVTTTAAPTAPSAGTAPPQVPVAGQLASAVAAMQRRGDGEYVASLDLHPAELGRVRVEIEIRAGVVNVQVAAEQAGTRGLLHDQLADLRAALEQGGMDTGQLDVASHGFGHDRDDGDGGADRSGPPEATSIASSPLSPIPSPTLVDLPSGRIDVRL